MSEVMDSYFIDDHILLQGLRSVAIKLVYIIGDHLELIIDIKITSNYWLWSVFGAVLSQ